MSASSPINQQSVGLCFTEVEEDKYGAVTVHVKEESMDAEVYVSILQASLSRWRQQGKKGVWIKLPTHLANLVVPTLEEGFRYHYAEPDYLLLVRCFTEVEEDKYGGVTLHMKELSMDAELYVPILQASLSRWRQQGKKGVWIKLPTHLGNLVVPTLKEGFRYHHAEPDYLMLVRWLPDTPDTLPGNASHTVGIGAFVMNDKNEVLVVQEKTGYFKNIDYWKMPTGIVNQGEDVCVAAVREVKEETGIDTEFQEILAFNQTHRHLHGKSDLFFVCMLRPCGRYEIEKQESELRGAKWMQIEKYAAQPFNQEHESFKIIADICKAKSKGEYVGFSFEETKTSSGNRLYLYFNGANFCRL